MSCNCGCENTEMPTSIEEAASSAPANLDIFSQQKFHEVRQMAWEIYQKMQLLADKRGEGGKENISAVIQCAWERAEQFYNFAKEREMEEEKSNKELLKCYVCGQKLIYGVYAVDVHGYKFCSKKCVLEAEGEKQEEADDA